MNFERWKIWLVSCICAIGFLFALPNLLPNSIVNKLPDFMPKQQVSLGLDLRGGSHMLLEVDTKTVVNDYMNQALDCYRDTLRKEKIAYTASFPKSIPVGVSEIEFDLRDSSRIGKAKGVLNVVDRDFTVAIDGLHVKITPKPGALEQRIFEAVSRSVEIVRKRVDENGTREVLVQKQGDDRILLQIPGLQDPARVKELLGKTAKLTFRLVDDKAPEINQNDKESAAAQLLNADYLPSEAPSVLLRTVWSIPLIIWIILLKIHRLLKVRFAIWIWQKVWLPTGPAIFSPRQQ